MAKKFIEKRKRGFIGWITFSLFWLFNVMMGILLFTYTNDMSSKIGAMSNEAERAGAEIGTGMGIMMLLMVWALGVVILGALSYFTRGRKEMIEVEV